MNLQDMKHPNQLTKEKHKELLKLFREDLEDYKSFVRGELSLEPKKKAESDDLFVLKAPEEEDKEGLLKFRVREWQFVIHEGAITVQVFLDKGSHDPFTTKEKVIVKEVRYVHEYFLEYGKALACFGENIAVEIGTAGSEPYVREECDFKEFSECFVKLEAWKKIDGRQRFSMLFDKVASQEGSEATILHVREGTQQFAIPLDEVKSCIALPAHELSNGYLMKHQPQTAKKAFGAKRKKKTRKG